MARTMAPSLTLLTISKALHRHFSGARHHLRPLLLARSSPAARRLGGCFHASRITSSTNSLCCYRSLGAVVLPVIRRRLQCLSSLSPSFRSISSGGGGGSGFGGYSGGGGGSNSGDSKAKLGAGVSVPSSDIIILDVRGMACGGCSASVKKIFESQETDTHLISLVVR